MSFKGPFQPKPSYGCIGWWNTETSCPERW